MPALFYQCSQLQGLAMYFTVFCWSCPHRCSVVWTLQGSCSSLGSTGREVCRYQRCDDRKDGQHHQRSGGHLNTGLPYPQVFQEKRPRGGFVWWELAPLWKVLTAPPYGCAEGKLRISGGLLRIPPTTLLICAHSETCNSP